MDIWPMDYLAECISIIIDLHLLDYNRIPDTDNYRLIYQFQMTITFGHDTGQLPNTTIGIYRISFPFG
ncbi:hypothetical protein M0811_12839 [Anaeramoeba ignava]|uniref:Uncharacterized protein n=1 Tax=Anaeramoeba ignava TaxID=1746090 RepID=A0A9Q0L8A6_ANAIG|nr:hypothetical protein M0811_12839 [Anaeramoeba ignava]